MNVEGIIRGCLGKVQYVNQALADKVAQQCTEKRGRAIRAYQCPACQQWHLTKQPLVVEYAARCGQCLEKFDPESPTDWRCCGCKSGQTS